MTQAFGKQGSRGKTIDPKRNGVIIGQREHLSDLDIKYANFLYKCPGEL